MAKRKAVSSSSESESSSSSSDSSSSSSSSSSDSSVDIPKKAKVSAPSELGIGHWVENEFVVELEPAGKQEVAKMKIRKFNGKVSVDIRKHYDNGTKPTPKGVSLKPELFEKLTSWKKIISECCDLVQGKIQSIKDKPTFLSTTAEKDDINAYLDLDQYTKVRVYLFKKMLLIDIRSYYNGGPTKKGISVSHDVFERIVNVREWREAVKKLA